MIDPTTGQQTTPLIVVCTAVISAIGLLNRLFAWLESRDAKRAALEVKKRLEAHNEVVVKKFDVNTELTQKAADNAAAAATGVNGRWDQMVKEHKEEIDTLKAVIDSQMKDGTLMRKQADAAFKFLGIAFDGDNNIVAKVDPEELKTAVHEIENKIH